MTRVAAAVAALALALTACGEPSAVDPRAEVVVSGQVLHADGTPVQGGTAMVIKEIGPDDFAASAPLFFGTMGISCLAGIDLDLCDEAGARADVADDGTFSVRLRGRDVQSGFGTVSTMWATAAAPSDGDLAGASASSAFTVGSESVQLPALRLWEPAVGVVEENGGVTVDVPRLPGEYGSDPRYEVRFESAEGALLWAARRRELPVDARVLEDAVHAVAVEASVDDAPGGSRATYRTAQARLAGPGAPPSRGAACATHRPGHGRVAHEPCPFTDGDLDEAFDAGGRSVVIDLGETRPVDLVVIRGDTDTFVVHTSEDGRTWQRLATLETTREHAALDAPPATHARYVRVRAQRGVLPALRELSIW
ncbi:MAG TPA: discoidin domain-containing protein [Pseudonocardia sp.]|nr:discoidin domain-containing protein [Pseudonocardia sp.]